MALQKTPGLPVSLGSDNIGSSDVGVGATEGLAGIPSRFK